LGQGTYLATGKAADWDNHGDGGNTTKRQEVRSEDLVPRRSALVGKNLPEVQPGLALQSFHAIQREIKQPSALSTTLWQVVELI
jgi:hypothetical protein